MEIYTENDIKELLTLSSKQVRALMTTEGFPSIKVGSKYRVEAEKFKEWLIPWDLLVEMQIESEYNRIVIVYPEITMEDWNDGLWKHDEIRGGLEYF